MDATIHAIQQFREFDVEAEQLNEKELSEFGIDATSSKKDEFTCKERVQHKYVDSIVSQLQLHFPHFQQIRVVAFSLFDLSRLPSKHTKIGTPGDEELKVLCDLYGKGDTADVDEDVVIAEREGFRFLMLQNYCQSSMKEVLKLLVADRTMSHLYPQLRKLATIAEHCRI